MKDKIEHNFKHHPPNAEKIVKHEKIRDMCKELALSLDESIADCRERAVAITKLEECMFWANAAIARNE